MCTENGDIQKPWESGRQDFSGAKRAVGVIRSRNEEGEREEGCDPDEKKKKNCTACTSLAGWAWVRAGVNKPTA